jgi:hypothetical protein
MASKISPTARAYVAERFTEDVAEYLLGADGFRSDPSPLGSMWDGIFAELADHGFMHRSQTRRYWWGPGDIWTIEFSAQSIGQATDIVRQHVPAGEAVPPVQEEGRCGYLLATRDYALIEAIITHVGRDQVIIGKR